MHNESNEVGCETTIHACSKLSMLLHCSSRFNKIAEIYCMIRKKMLFRV